MPHCRSSIALLLLASVAAGCGQKGPLLLPDGAGQDERGNGAEAPDAGQDGQPAVGTEEGRDTGPNAERDTGPDGERDADDGAPRDEAAADGQGR